MILTDENFDKEISEAKLPVIVDFYADWCGPCRTLGPILEKIAKEMEDKVILAKVNVDSAKIASSKFEVDRIPMVMLFKDNKAISGFIGVAEEADIKKWLNE
ncbi:MAG: thioredoxin, partial [Candidatus Staskawiczbacteria bacterium]|nr:thioredoxin [Candidatus Staskawiczbacteria bacterium]